MQPIVAKNVIVQMLKGGQYQDFVCTQSMTIAFTASKISVKTLGDGIYARSRTQSISYTISLTGLIPFDDEADVNTFDLLDYLKGATDVQYRIAFKQPNGDLYTSIVGIASADQITLSNANDFLTGSIELNGQGEPEIRTDLDVCAKVITNATFTLNEPDAGDLYISIIALNSGTVGRYDYRVDNGPINTNLSAGWHLYGIGTGHTIEIWPVCDNGIYGTVYTRSF